MSADRDAVLRARLLHDLLFFARWFFKALTGQRFQVAPHHIQIAEALTRVAAGETTRLIINIPPRYGKTELAVKMFVAWIIANNPRAKSIHLSYSDELAMDNSSAIRELVKHEEFQRLFPTALKTDSDSKKKWYTAQGGGLYATAAGGAITGFGAGLLDRVPDGTGSPADGFGGVIVIDDPLKPDDAFSEARRAQVNRRFNNTIASRTNSQETPIIVIMQRLHEEDMTGYLLGGGSGEPWEHICLPAIAGDAPLWPEKHTLDRLRAMEAADAYTFAGQYMQRPAPLGGGLFRDDWWRYYTALPKLDWRAIYVDTAQKTGEKNDYTVLQCWGRSYAGQAVLVDQLRGKWEAPELLTQARAFWNKHKVAPREQGVLRAMKIEDKVSGTGLIQTLRREGVPVVGIPRDRDKYTRAMDGSPLVESGNVLLPQNAPWLSGYLAEFSAFPNGAHDDQIDPTLDAIADMLGSQVINYSELL
jgi:predicted phage terminase large subunit-like protein